MSIKIICLLILSGIFAISSYGFFRLHVTDFYELLRKYDIYHFDSKELFAQLETQAKDVCLFSKEKEEQTKLKQFLNNHDEYISIHVYNHETGKYITGSYGEIIEKRTYTFIPIEILQNDFEQYSYNLIEIMALDFKDGIGDVYVTDMHDLKYSVYYFYFSLFVCLFIFFVPTFLFIRRKVKDINRLKNEILVMAQGDLHHPITIKSHDELAILAKEIDHLRVTLDQNIQSEAQIKKANSELITSLSHDLRTPLTSLMGYLDILRLHRYQNEEQFNRYLANCMEKVNQINDLSNKTFEYAFVFETDKKIELNEISSQAIIQYVKENLEYLKLEGLQVDGLFDLKEVNMIVDFSMIKRIINNLCSNIHKYASRKEAICVDITMKHNVMKLSFSNRKKDNVDVIESNHIGLKSVKRMVELHQGNVFIQDLKDSFMIVITIPYQ